MEHNDLLVCALDYRLSGHLRALFLGKTCIALTHLWVVIKVLTPVLALTGRGKPWPFFHL